MKKVLFNAAFLLAGFLLAGSVNAQKDHKDKDGHKKEEPKFKKTKSYTKSYNLSSSDRVSLSNQFGEMKLTTWDKNEVKVDITIIGKSDDEPRAQEILDRISITDSKDGSTVSFKTKFADNDKDKKDKDKDHKKEHNNEGMEVNYAVYLPATAALDAQNQFGKMIIPDYRGEAEIECKFGSLTAGKISNAKEVTVEFGEATIAHINGGKLNIKFSEGTVNKLSGDVKTDLSFSQVKLVIDNDIKGLDIHNSYSTVYLDLDKNLSATYDIHTSHGEFSNKTSFAIKEEGKEDRGYGPRFNRTYSGKSGGGSSKVKINSSFGEIVIGHDLKVDLSEKHKDKHKTREI
ncbi:MAG: hypothetical protein ACHQFX_15465 [Chitinophagales bacterium]